MFEDGNGVDEFDRSVVDFSGGVGLLLKRLLSGVLGDVGEIVGSVATALVCPEGECEVPVLDLDVVLDAAIVAGAVIAGGVDLFGLRFQIFCLNAEFSVAGEASDSLVEESIYKTFKFVVHVL
ncbi:hypothetical protein ACFQH8_18170 [Halomicroarcula sp. GCM10025710]